IDSGVEREGVVTDTSPVEKLALIDNGIQEFWYPPEEIIPIPLTEDRLINTLGFTQEETPDGIKYKRGPFRVLVHDPGNYTNWEIWYREDHRHFTQPLYVHELQNHYLQMTKVPLERV
ncbi:MAG TPA: hypothetical protein VGE66_10530, partial [Chitinophagaceae bacterium]